MTTHSQPTPKHTPTPAFALPLSLSTPDYAGDHMRNVLDANRDVVCRLGYRDAAHIVHCVNSHDALVAENKRLREGLKTVAECGLPFRASLYDEEGVEGWRWAHPDGREWDELGAWHESPPMHPLARALLAETEGSGL